MGLLDALKKMFGGQTSPAAATPKPIPIPGPAARPAPVAAPKPVPSPTPEPAPADPIVSPVPIVGADTTTPLISAQQKLKIERVVNVFETGTPAGHYGQVTLLDDGPGNIRQVTYGRSQTTEFGNLKELIQAYIQNNGTFASQFAAYVNKIGQQPSLASDANFISLLKNSAAQDPIMKSTQDSFFDKRYYQPAFTWFTDNGFTQALSLLVIYDSYIHSGSIRSDIRNTFPESPPAKGGDEKVWITKYVDAREHWLSTRSNPIVQATVYRTQCFRQQIAHNNWDLSQVVNANGTNVN